MELSTLDDASLIALIAARPADRTAANQQRSQAIALLYDRYGRLVYTVAYHTTGDETAAEEITQDVFLRVWIHAAGYHPEVAKVSTWLVSITRNRAIDELRRRGSRPEHNQVEWAEESAMDSALTQEGLEEPVAQKLHHLMLRKVVGELPPDQRRILGLAYFRGLTHQEIADQTGEPLGTIKSRIRLALQKLRQRISEIDPVR